MNQLAPPHSLGSITPVIITFNEQSNLGRTLDALHWAKAIIIVDSGSTDDTIQIAHAYPNTTVHHRPFDSFANQWNHALQLVPTEWALCLDADCIVSPELAQEMNQLDFEATDGYRAPFKYCICGKPLRSSLLPPRVVLVPVKRQHFINDGHFQVPEKQNDIRSLSGYLLHDDRKSLRRWLHDQLRHAELEAGKLKSTAYQSLNAQDKIRRLHIIAPWLVALYCLFYQGVILDGWRGCYYTAQRIFAELLLSYKLATYKAEADKIQT